MPFKALSRDMLGQEVRWVHFACNFVQREVSHLQSLLNPKLPHREVAHSAYAASSAYAYRCGRICMHADPPADTSIARETLET